ncbi:MAG: uroporphyrinogen-III synthase, partial [Planctomycetota bacterium]
GEVDGVCFTSASTVRSLVDLAGKETLAKLAIFSIGDKTSAEITTQGLAVTTQSNQATLDALVHACVASFEPNDD